MPTQNFHLKYYNAAETLQLRESLLGIYLASHADQQNNPWFGPKQFWDRLVRLYAPGRDFGLMAGFVDDAMVGYAFGSPRDKADDVLKMAIQAIPDIAISMTEPVYIFREFAVDPAFQRKGYGRSLHDALLKSRPERLAHLLVRSDNTAKNAYRHWGWRIIGHVQPFSDAPIMEAMVRILPL